MAKWRDRCRPIYLEIICLVLVNNVHHASCYNLDTKFPVIRNGAKGSFFGFSVAIHSEGDTDMLMVGAPRYGSGSQTKPGAVWKCPVDNLTCDKISEEEPQDDTRNTTDQWLGATVRSSGADGTVLTCAPFTKEIRETTGVHPSGRCIFYTNGFSNANGVSPCEPNDDARSAFKYQSHCLAGFSAEKIGDDYVIGGPGSYTGQGSIFTTTDDDTFISPEEEHEASDGNYQGYSVAFGNFSDSPDMDIITGVPRGDKLLGLVRIYNQDMILIREIKGNQVGSYFGESVTGSDLNGDGLDDLVVGASNYWNRETHQIDVGQVHIYYQTSLGTFDESNTVITGQHERGRFGLVICALGDINDDGVNDLAVSAPYEDDGAVYIYNGRKGEKIKTKPSQVLRPSDFNISMTPFGFALSANRDADKNMYPDLLVGSYQSDTVILIRTKPVIRPFITVEFNSPGVNLTGRTVHWGGGLVSGFGGKICMNYSGLGTNDSYDFNITLTMDVDKQIARAEFYTDDTTSTRVINHPSITIGKSNKARCEDFTAFLKDQLVDKVSPITIRVNSDVIQDLNSLPAGEIPHVLDVYSKVKDAQIPIFFDCLNSKCSPNLQTLVKSDKPTLYFGDDTEVALTITVTNTADEAFGAHLYALLPDDAKFLSFRLVKSDLSILCKMVHQLQSVDCDIGNPIPKKTEIVFEIRLQIFPVPGDKETLPIMLIANSTSEEDANTQGDNNVTLTWNLEPKVGLLLDGSANIDQVIYNDTDVAMKQIDSNNTDSTVKADKVVHTYWVQNIGPAKISSAVLEVKWPMKTDDNRYLLYLTNVTLSNGQVCITEGGVNPDNLYDEENDEFETRDIPKRNRMTSSAITSDEDSESREVSADCSKGYSGCVNITCNFGNIENNGTNIILKIESRLMLNSLLMDNEPKEWDIKSTARFTVNSIPYITQPVKTPEEVKTLSLRTIPLTFTEGQSVPLWVIILSVVLGCLLLIIVIFILYKVGFFQRNKIDLDKLKQSYERGQSIDEAEGSDIDAI